MREKSPTDFVTQFVKDLSSPNVSNLTQIRWIFDHEKMDAGTVKIKVLAALNGNKSSLNLQSIRNLFESYRQTVGYDKAIIDNDRLFEFLNDNNDWFNLIFK